MSVSSRFTEFLDNIGLTEAQISSGTTHKQSVVRCLNSTYYDSASESANAAAVGSWAKFTRIRPPRDVDVLFELPAAVYHRYQNRTGNRQSQLLQEVKGVLQKSFAATDIRGDGPIVLVPFSAFSVEVIPAFRTTNGQFLICLTDNGGRYKTADYAAEIKRISDVAKITNNNLRPLIRMLKCWQGYCNVEIKSFWLELTAADFLSGWEHREKTKVYYDWMIRDYFSYLLKQKNGYVYAPGTNEIMGLGNRWESKCDSALGRAKKACDFEASDRATEAGEEWQKIFGSDMPKIPK